MTGLLLILSDAGGERCAAAMELAGVCAAMDRPVAVLLRGSAAKAFSSHVAKPPGLEMLRELGAEISVCQTAMAANGLTAAELPEGVQPGGMVAFMAGRERWQLLLV